MLSTILVAVPAFSRVEPAMISGPTDGARRGPERRRHLGGFHHAQPAARARADEDHPSPFSQRLGNDLDAVRDLFSLALDRRKDFPILVDDHVDDVADCGFVDREAGGIDLLGRKRLPLGLGRHLTTASIDPSSPAATAMSQTDIYLHYLRDVPRMSPHTVSS